MESTTPPPPLISSADKPPLGGLRGFFAILVALAVLNLGLAFVGVPIAFIPAFTVVVTALFVMAPFIALFAGSAEVEGRTPLLLLIIGVLLHVGGIFLLRSGALPGPVAAVVAALGQVGLVTWCLALGGFLGMLIKDKNMLVPIAVFMAAFDIFLVLTPAGFTQQLMKKAPELHQSVSLVIPRVVEAPTAAPVQPLAFIGPADLLFTAMFFTVLFRHRMRTRQTLTWLVPALVLYLVLALLVGPLPALVPIGLTVLIVNWPELRLTKQEWGSTLVVAILGIAIVMLGRMLPAPKAEPSKPVGGQGAPAPEGSPEPAGPGQPQ